MVIGIDAAGGYRFGHKEILGSDLERSDSIVCFARGGPAQPITNDQKSRGLTDKRGRIAATPYRRFDDMDRSILVHVDVGGNLDYSAIPADGEQRLAQQHDDLDCSCFLDSGRHELIYIGELHQVAGITGNGDFLNGRAPPEITVNRFLNIHHGRRHVLVGSKKHGFPFQRKYKNLSKQSESRHVAGSSRRHQTRRAIGQVHRCDRNIQKPLLSEKLEITASLGGGSVKSRNFGTGRYAMAIAPKSRAEDSRGRGAPRLFFQHAGSAGHLPSIHIFFADCRRILRPGLGNPGSHKSTCLSTTHTILTRPELIRIARC